MSNSAETQECIDCKQPIRAGANLCQHCNTYQDWRKHLRVPNITLALLTALVSVLALALPAIVDLFHVPESEAAIVDIAVDGTRVRATAMNWGDDDAVLGTVVLRSNHLAPATKVRLTSDEMALIQPGTNLLSFDVVPLLSEGQSYAASLDAMTRMLVEAEDDSLLLFEVMQSNGRLEIHKLRLTNADIFQLLRANADRCSAVVSPNFENGCIGPGEIESERYSVSGPRLDDDDNIVD